MKIAVVSRISYDSLDTAIELANTADAKIVLLTDAVYMLNQITEDPGVAFHALKEDLEKRLPETPSWVTPLEYADFVDLIMADGSTIRNL